MKIELIPKTDLTSKQTQALADLTRAVYPPTPNAVPNAAPSPIHWAATTHSVLIYKNDGALVSHTGALIRSGTHNGNPVRLGGIGGVKTHPHARHQGCARAGIHSATEFLRAEHKVDFSLLVCREELVTFYCHLGWQHFGGEVLVEQPTGKEEFTFNEPMVLSAAQSAPTKGIIDLCGMPW